MFLNKHEVCIGEILFELLFKGRRRGPSTCAEKKERDQYSPIRTEPASSMKYLL